MADDTFRPSAVRIYPGVRFGLPAFAWEYGGKWGWSSTREGCIGQALLAHERFTVSGDIVERLRIDCECYDSDTCVHAAARDEIEQLRAEIERLRAADQYVEDLGVDWCVLHHGVRDEDSDRCDAFDWADGDDMLDEDGEYLPCDLRPLAYQEARRG